MGLHPVRRAASVAFGREDGEGLPRLASRNPPPMQAYGEETCRLGLEEAWKLVNREVRRKAVPFVGSMFFYFCFSLISCLI